MPQPTYFSFRQASDWQNGHLSHLELKQHSLHLKREKRYKHSKRLSFTPTDDQDSWLDAHYSINGWYWLNNRNQIFRYEHQLKQRELILQLSISDKAYRLAVQGEYIYLLTINSEAIEQDNSSQLHCYYVNNGQLKWKIDNWKQHTFFGLSLAVTSHEAIVVLAQTMEQEEAALLQFDSLGLPMQEAKLPKPIALTNELYGQGWHSSNRIIEQDNKVYMLDQEQKQLITYHSLSNSLKVLELPQVEGKPSTFSIDDDGNFWIVCNKEKQGKCELLCINTLGEVIEEGQLLLDYCDYMIWRKHALYVFNLLRHDIYILEPKLLPLFSTFYDGFRGQWISPPMDSGVIDNEWHRFVLSLRKEHDTAVNVKYYASNSGDIDHEKLQGLWQHQWDDPTDALFIHAKGRYLWISIELIGTDLHSPHIDSLEVHFPRQSYVKDLPVIFQRSDNGFLTQFLSIFQTMLEDTDILVDSATRKLEGSQVHSQSLKWLISWLGLDTDDYWTEEQLRLLLLEAPKLYSLRGTKYAIEKLVEIYTGSKPIILEYEDIKPLKENVELGEVVDRLYAADEHTFNVLVKADDVNSELKKITLQHILDRYKPVFTHCKLVILQPWVYMDLHSYLGMNTFLTAPQQLLLNGRSSMPHHTITLDNGQQNQLDKHSRLGLNSKLE